MQRNLIQASLSLSQCQCKVPGKWVRVFILILRDYSISGMKMKKWRAAEEVKVAAERRKKKLSNVPDLVPSTFQIPDLILDPPPFSLRPFHQLLYWTTVHSQETQTQPATTQSRKHMFKNDCSACARSAEMKSFHLAGQSGQLSWPSVTSLLTRSNCFFNWRFGSLSFSKRKLSCEIASSYVITHASVFALKSG